MIELTNDKNKYWSLTIVEVERILDTDIKNGLSVTEAKNRREKFGPNIIESSKRANSLMILLNQFKSPLILVLIFTGIVTLFISHYRDSIFIFIAVVVNSLLGFWQENKTEQALSKLKTYLKQNARVIRGGKEISVDISDVVLGDLVKLSQGDRVSADSRVVEVNDFQVDESILTGESLPVVKSVDPVGEESSVSDQTSMLFAGTLVTQGVCTAVVCGISENTQIGKIASLISSSESEKTPLQKSIIKFSIQLSIFIGILTVIVFGIGVLYGESFLEMFLTSVAIAVTAIPEGLPVSMTVILAVGVERMAKRKGVVRKLIAAEALGSTTIILTDKTGTLTEAVMEMSEVISLNLKEKDLLLRALKNASVLIENPEDDPKFWKISGKIMEVALVKTSALRGIPLGEILDKSEVVQSIPFNAVQKFSASLVRRNDGYVVYVYGAPDILIENSSLDDNEKIKILNQIDNLANSGKRVLGVASKEVHNVNIGSFTKNFNLRDITFDGMITFHDPIRSGISKVIERVKSAGVRTVILTGDHKGTAIAVAREIGMTIDDGSVLDATEVASLSDADLKEKLKRASVIARVTPFDKLRVAKLFQEMGEVVAMTGDGVNDAPSIKQANVGIAMGSGTEVTRSVADLVLLDDNFETIVSAIEEGRQILRNIRKVLVYLLSNVMDGLILIGGSIIAGIPLPINALQMLWVNFFSDSFPAVAFAFERDPDGLLHKPSGNNMILFNPLMKFLILVIGSTTSLLLFVVYYLLLKIGYHPELVGTFIFASFGTYTLLVALSVRSFNLSILKYRVFSNRYLTVGILIGFALMAAAIYVPFLQDLFDTVSLPFYWVLGVFFIGFVNIFLIEITKWFFEIRKGGNFSKI